MSDYRYYADMKKTAEKRLEYLNKRLAGVNRELRKQTNKALLNALNEEIDIIQNDITKEKRTIRRAGAAISQLDG